jgi:hypothetical protein
LFKSSFTIDCVLGLCFCAFSLGLYIGLHFIYLLFILLCIWLSSYSCSFFNAWDSLNDSHHAYIYYCHHYNCFFFVEVECGLPFYFRRKSFQKVVDYPPFEHVVKIVDHTLLIKILIYIFFWPCPFQKKE